MKKISVVIPCYNGEKYLRNCLDSIVNQRYPYPFEIIIIDDCSNDNSLKIAKEYAYSEDLNLNWRLFRNKYNMGRGYTRQKGYELANGDYVSFLSVDDYWIDPYFLYNSSRYLDKYHGTYTDYYRFNESYKKTNLFIAPEYSYENLIIWALNKNMFINFSSIIIPKIDVRFETNLNYGEDLIFLLDTIIKGLIYVKVPNTKIFYRVKEKKFYKRINYKEYDLLWKYVSNRLIKLGLDKRLIYNCYLEDRNKYKILNLIKRGIIF